MHVDTVWSGVTKCIIQMGELCRCILQRCRVAFSLFIGEWGVEKKGGSPLKRDVRRKNEEKMNFWKQQHQQQALKCGRTEL